jgi:hypothetical protein
MKLIFTREMIEDNDHNNRWAYSIDDLCSDWLEMSKEIADQNELIHNLINEINEINENTNSL